MRLDLAPHQPPDHQPPAPAPGLLSHHPSPSTPYRTHSAGPAAAADQFSFGNYVSPQFGEGIESGDVRSFLAGDRVGHINWRASLRRGQLYVTQFQEERSADIVLLLEALIGNRRVAVPSGTRAVLAGLGVTIAFAAALYAGIVPTGPGG
ncbi:MAG TPA: DUF58 domain-containing protein [Xanthobacteraceae bacterium]|nr:DUF58 domain-containing protein [Xanthobacteraceae bacterium]